MGKRGIPSPIRFLLFLALIPGSALRAGSIDPAFEAKIDPLEETAMVSAMVMMPEQLDLVTLDNELIRDKADRQERHERVVLALQAKARETQGAVKAHLESAMARGEVESFHPFWVTNAIAVTGTKSFIRSLAERADVGIIYEDLVIPLEKLHGIAPSDGGEPPRLSSIEPGVTSMNADSLWRMGITGQGVLVCNLDTGVTGSHPALVNKWRGNNGGSAAASWFDPYNNSTFPVDDDGHGTATMGCITGVDPATGDSVGVAPGAQWIAANVFESNITTSSAFTQAFEWTIDPDGDPATIEDVPDVVSNSWGASFANCNTQYWNSIDANMTAGVMVVFSAGNEGPGPQSIGSPASRSTSPTNAFAVGATNRQNNIANFSSRGPSECDGTTIKPEVVAHGVSVRSANRGGGYSSFNSGTSFSCPYVAGALALLRQAAPWATGDEIMTAMMNTAVDLGEPGEDNTYGHGIPDLVAALDEVSLLDRNPRITFSGSVVDDGNNGEPEAGESFDLKVWLGNLGIAATGVEATLSLADPDPLVTIDQNSSTFGDIAHDLTGHNSSNPFHITLDAATPGAHVMNFLLDVTADGGAYQVQLPFSLRTPFVITLADHDIGNVLFSVSDGGRFGWDTLDQRNGSGFVFPISDQDQLFEGALVAGYDSVHVSHSARGTPSGPVETDWQLVPGGEVTITTPGSFSDQDGFSMYSDAGAALPMGVDVVQNSYAWSGAGSDDFVIVELTFINTGVDSSSDISNFYAGVYMDWDIRPFGQLPLNNAAVDVDNDLGYMWNTSSDKYCAVHVLTDPGVASFDVINNQDGSYDFSRAEFWNSLSGGLLESGTAQDFSYVLSTGPFDLPHQDSVTVAFAILGGEGFDDLLANVAAARDLYGSPVSVGGGAAGGVNGLPKAFGLAQNYPNPFNPSTTIRFQVPAGAEATHVTLEIFDVRGRKVRTLVDADRGPGNHAVQWNGRSDRGEEVSSGVYLYRIHAGSFDATRRMLLLK
jgi:subtilisin family serine protease